MESIQNLNILPLEYYIFYNNFAPIFLKSEQRNAFTYPTNSCNNYLNNNMPISNNHLSNFINLRQCFNYNYPYSQNFNNFSFGNSSCEVKKIQDNNNKSSRLVQSSSQKYNLYSKDSILINDLSQSLNYVKNKNYNIDQIDNSKINNDLIFNKANLEKKMAVIEIVIIIHLYLRKKKINLFL